MTFVTRHENVLFLGPPGVGKSHLAVALAVEAISQGISVYFVSLSQLIEDLRKAYTKTGWINASVSIFDQSSSLLTRFGYLPFDSLAANLFFQVVSARYERGSILLTSNKSFGEWGN
nr:ATP-binding protein [Brevibacillus thermoruber]